jgi:hypothetical protein
LKFGDEVTEWITVESVRRVLDEAVSITAKRMVDTEEQLKAGTNVRRFPRSLHEGLSDCPLRKCHRRDSGQGDDQEL